MRTTLTIRDGAAWIILDDGKVNAMSLEMLREIEGSWTMRAAQMDRSSSKGAPASSPPASI